MTDQAPDLAQLRTLAEAIDGEWACSHDEPSPHRPPDTYDVYLADGSAEVLANLPWELAAYVAAADPGTVLWLIREVERLQYEVSETQTDLDNERECRDLDDQTAELRADVIREEWQIARARAEKAEATIARIEAMPVGPPSGGYFVVSMREVRAALDGGEPDA